MTSPETLPPRLGETLQAQDATLAPDWDPATTMGPRVAANDIPALPRLGLVGDVETPEFRIGEPIGRGATAVVYAAEHLPLGRTVAIKALRPERGEARDALIDEARIACLEHPNIVPVHAVGLDADDRPLMVMKRIDGEPWQQVMADPDHPLWRRWPGDALERTLQVGLRVADALSAAHAAGVLHRDVKPSNVVLGARGEVYLIDWGIAARLDAHGRLDAALAGTPAYMAPEMFDESRPLDRRSDVYLLGATLFAALTGRPPRRGRTLMALVARALGEPPSLPDVPDELAAIVRRSMAPDPDERYPDVEALRAAIVAFLDHRQALEWTARADARRVRLERADDDPQLRDGLIAEARFGYRSALDAWPECSAAREGLDALLDGVIRADLERGDVAAARRALAELPRPRPDLQAALADAERRVAGERAELEAARARTEALDREGGHRSRRRWLPLLVLLLLVGPIRLGVIRLLGIIEADHIHPSRPIAPLLIALGIEVYIRRRPGSGAGTLYNRNILRFGQITMIASALAWLRPLFDGAGIADTALVVIALQGVAAAVMALLLDRRFGLMVLSAALSATAGLIVPLAAELALGLHLLVTILVLERAWMRGDGAPVSADRAASSDA